MLSSKSKVNPSIKERPILFSAPMVRAILDGSKTQTRRIVKVRGEQPPEWATFAQEGSSLSANGKPRKCGLFYWSEEQPAKGPLKTLRRWPILPSNHLMAGDHYWTHCPYGQPGDRLWVRETWQGPIWDGDFFDRPEDAHSPKYCEYAADGGSAPEYMDGDDNLICRWRPSIHMPRWASRITLEVTSVRVERLQQITEGDARAEGLDFSTLPDPGLGAARRKMWINLWDSINGPGSWDANPWVWVVEFKRIEAGAVKQAA